MLEENTTELLYRNETEMWNPSDLDKYLNEFVNGTTMKPTNKAIIITAYSLIVSIAVSGNLMVMLAVAWRKEMRTARNIFIFNLSMSDFTLSLTIPLTAIDAFSPAWLFGNTDLFCKFVKSISCVAVFMSSLTIVTIAIDRYRMICHSSSTQVGPRTAWTLLPLICMTATALSSPLIYCSKVANLNQIFEYVKGNATIPEEYIEPFSNILICYEDWSMGSGKAPTNKDRLWFTIYSSSVQFLLPLAIISFIYLNIYIYLKNHRLHSRTNDDRQRRTNLILFAISLIFCLSWLPFSAYCIIVEVFQPFEDTETMMLVYCVCHLVGMSSACTNPILYGFLNESFVKEITLMFSCMEGCFKSQSPPNVIIHPAKHRANRLSKYIKRLQLNEVGQVKDAESIPLQDDSNKLTPNNNYTPVRGNLLTPASPTLLTSTNSVSLLGAQNRDISVVVDQAEDNATHLKKPEQLTRPDTIDVTIREQRTTERRRRIGVIV